VFRVFALDSYIRPRWKKKEIQFTPRRQTEFSAAEITAFIGAAVNLACKLPDTREFAGATFEPELNGDLRAVGVPRRFFLAFFLPPSSRATHDRPDFKVPIRGGWKRRESEEDYSISVDSCHGHVSDAGTMRTRHTRWHTSTSAASPSASSHLRNERSRRY